MTVSSKPLALGGAALGGIGAVGGGVYVATRPGTVANQLGTEWLLATEENGNEEEFKELLAKLKKDSSSDLNENVKLKEIKEETKNDAWEKLRDWCKKTYKEKYQGEENSLWKLSRLYCKKPSIGDKLEEIKLSSDKFEKEWNEKVNKAKKEEGGTKDKELRGNLKNSVEGNEKTTLIAWCKEKYEKPFDAKIKDSEEKLLNEVKSFCTLTIKEKIGEENLLSKGSGLEAWKAVQNKKLKEEATTTDLSDIFKDLHEKLKKTNPAVGDEETKNACLSVYEKGYKGEDNKLFKNVKKYCSYTIKEKLISEGTDILGKLFTDTTDFTTDNADLKGKMGSLTSDAAGTDKVLQSKFTEWSSGKENVEKQKEFRTWCQDLYKKQWDGKNQNEDGNYKLAHAHCKKN